MKTWIYQLVKKWEKSEKLGMKLVTDVVTSVALARPLLLQQQQQ